MVVNALVANGWATGLVAAEVKELAPMEKSLRGWFWGGFVASTAVARQRNKGSGDYN
jgi:hypothetical protein